jgi:hypothetical protein
LFKRVAQEGLIKTVSSELLGQGLMANVLGGLRTIEYLKFNPGKPTFKSVISDIMFTQERILGIVGFGAIGMKLIYDISVGKATNTVYGFEQTKFNPDEISYIIKEFEDMQNQRLEENGYEPIDFQGMLELPEEEFEELVSTFDIPVVESNEAIQQEVESEEDEILDIQEKEQITNEAEYLESLTSDLYEL